MERQLSLLLMQSQAVETCFRINRAETELCAKALALADSYQHRSWRLFAHPAVFDHVGGVWFDQPARRRARSFINAKNTGTKIST